LEAVAQEWQAMSTPVAAPVAALIRERVKGIETMPTIPTVFLPLLDMLSLPPDRVKVDEVVKLVSYDNTIAAQCLRVASSPLFGLAKSPESIKAAVLTLGLKRVQTILLTCCMGNAFPVKNWALDANVFWKHSLGCAMVCQKFSEKLGAADSEKAYMAGLLHDIGLLVNCMVFPKEFATAVTEAAREQIPLYDAERTVMGFSHCESGRALAERWNLPEDMVQAIAHHHDPERSEAAYPLVALVHLSDLLCRMRALGYGYYERQKVDLVEDPAWAVLLKEYRSLAGVDLVRFTFELDEAVEGISGLVSTIFGGAAGKN
jgi:putative nucleotidyltransferase with HDIG domain